MDCDSCYKGMQKVRKGFVVMRMKTNADHIRAMSDEELAQWLTYPVCAYTDCCKRCPASPENNREKCDENILEWLQQPAKEG